MPQPNTTNTVFNNGLEASKFLNIPRSDSPSTTGLLQGALNYFPTEDKLKYWDGTTWQPIAAGVIEASNLQETTDEGNTTTNAIQITNYDNIDPSVNSLALYNTGTGLSYISNIYGTTETGLLNFSPTITALSKGSTNLFLGDETVGVAGAAFTTRVSGSNAINPTDFPTLSQVTALIPSPGTLQSVTNGANNNLTTNIIGVTGESNLPSDFTGTALGHRITGEISSGVTKYNEGIGIGGLNIEDERSEVFFGSSSFSLRFEDGTTAGAYINKRLQISNGINSQDAVTMNQLAAAAGTLQSVTTGTNNNKTTNSVHIAGEDNFISNSDGLTFSALLQSNSSTSFIQNNKGATETEISTISLFNETGSNTGQITFFIGGTDETRRSLRLYQTAYDGGNGVIANFNGKVVGQDATSNNQFTTLGQVNALIPVASSYIQNQNAVVQTPGNFNISGNGQANSFRALDNFSVGGTIATDINLQVNKAMSSTSSRAIEVSSTIGSGVSIARMFNATPTVSGSASLVNLHTFEANDATINAGGSVSNQRGFVGLLTSGTGKYNLYLSGTAANHLNGNTLVGTLTDNGEKLQVNGKATVSTAPTNPTDVVRLTDLSGYVTTNTNQTGLTGNKTWDGVQTFTNQMIFSQSGNSGFLVNSTLKLTKSSGTYFEGSGNGIALFTNPTGGVALLNADNLTVQRQFQFPNAAGTLALTSDLAGYVTIATSQTVTANKDFSGNINFYGTTFDVDNDNISLAKINVNGRGGGSPLKPFMIMNPAGTTNVSPTSTDIPAGFDAFALYGKRIADGTSHLSWKVRKVGSTDLADYGGSLLQTPLTADREWTLPDRSGVVALDGDYAKLSGDNFFTNGGVQTYYNNATTAAAFINTTSGLIGMQSGTDTKFSTIGFDGIVFNTHGLMGNGYAVLKSDNLSNAIQTFQVPDISGLLPAITSATPPATSSGTGKAGTMIISGGYLYICIATDSWVRAAASTF